MKTSPRKPKTKSNSGQLAEFCFIKIFSPEDIAQLAVNGGKLELLFRMGLERNPGKISPQLIMEVVR